MTIRDIVVGVDGSAESDAALRWAAHEARRHQARLIALHTHDPVQHAFDNPLEEGYEQGPVPIAKVIVDSAVAEVRSLEPTVRVQGETAGGGAAATLIRASGPSAMVVVGSRGRGGFTGLLLGSVSQHVATHAAGPVVVVRAQPGRPDGPVVVGVDESDGSGHVLDVAFEEAALRDGRIVVLHAYLPDVRTWGLDLPPEVEDEGVRRTLEADRLSEIVRPWRRTFPTVDVEVTAAEGQAAARLVDASGSAQLIVVGSRGRGGFTGLLLGSVGLQLLHHSDCPVLIARDSSAGSGGGVR